MLRTLFFLTTIALSASASDNQPPAQQPENATDQIAIHPGSTHLWFQKIPLLIHNPLPQSPLSMTQDLQPFHFVRTEGNILHLGEDGKYFIKVIFYLPNQDIFITGNLIFHDLEQMPVLQDAALLNAPVTESVTQYPQETMFFIRGIKEYPVSIQRTKQYASLPYMNVDHGVEVGSSLITLTTPPKKVDFYTSASLSQKNIRFKQLTLRFTADVNIQTKKTETFLSCSDQVLQSPPETGTPLHKLLMHRFSRSGTTTRSAGYYYATVSFIYAFEKQEAKASVQNNDHDPSFGGFLFQVPVQQTTPRNLVISVGSNPHCLRIP